MQDKTVVITLLFIVSMTLSIAPAFAFYHPATGTEDNMYENFGPRIDRILIKMYASLDAEIAALQAGEIDITDWSLTKPMIDALTLDPNISILRTGGSSGYYTLNFNNNGNQYLGNPPNPLAPNPVYPNPMSDVKFRQAVSMSIDNVNLTYLASGTDMYDPIYVPIPAYMTFWTHPDIRPGGALEALTYPYDGPDFPNGNALLDTDFPINASTGFRFWDMNHDGVEQINELVHIKFYVRQDLLRKTAGDMEEAGLIAMHIRYTRSDIVSGSTVIDTIMTEGNYHSYTGAWIYIGPDSDYLYDLYSYDSYWWNGERFFSNYGAIGQNNPEQNADLLALKIANDSATALAAARAFQEKFAANACEKPLASTAIVKAFSKYYTGGNDGAIVNPDDDENLYRGFAWDNIVNQNNMGENSWWSTLNMYPTGYPMGDGSHMTVRYGWELTDMPHTINPIYSSWYWESEIWGRVIDGGGARNPMTMGPVEVPQLMESWTQGTWVDPADGITKTSITVHMKPSVLWNDGQPCTIDDFIYTLAQMPDEMDAKVCSSIWWQPTLDQIAGYTKLDDYSAIILMKVNSFLTTNWVIGNVILPKHFWQPFIAANHPVTIMGDIGPGLIGTGPFLYTSLTPGATATLVRNPTYYRRYPDDIITSFVATDGSVQISPNKIKPDAAGFGTGVFNFTVMIENEQKFFTESYALGITYQYVGPGAPGPVLSVPGVVSPVTVVAGGTAVQNFAFSLSKGEYEFIVTKVITSPAYMAMTETQTERVKLTVNGDVNGDWKVNILDITPIAIRLGAVVGDAGSPPLPEYDAISDLNHDGKINILDIVQVALVFGWDP